MPSNERGQRVIKGAGSYSLRGIGAQDELWRCPRYKCDKSMQHNVLLGVRHAPIRAAPVAVPKAVPKACAVPARRVKTARIRCASFEFQNVFLCKCHADRLGRHCVSTVKTSSSILPKWSHNMTSTHHGLRPEISQLYRTARQREESRLRSHPHAAYG